MTTRRRSGRRTLRTTAAVLALGTALAATACGGDHDSGGFKPHPPKKDQTTQAAPGEDGDGADGGGTGSGDRDPSLPVFLYPNGQEVVLTAPGTTLSYGDNATVATADTEGRLLVWTIAVHDGVVRAPDQVTLLDPAEGAGVDHYLCYAYDITFLGAVPRYTDDPVVLTAVPDTTQAVPVPSMTPVTRDGLNANQVVGSADDGCGIPADNRLPVTENRLEPGHAYARGVLSHVPSDTSLPSVPVGARFDYGSGVPGASNDRTKPASVTWR